MFQEMVKLKKCGKNSTIILEVNVQGTFLKIKFMITVIFNDGTYS
jgi:hypothetical protein